MHKYSVHTHLPTKTTICFILAHFRNTQFFSLVFCNFVKSTDVRYGQTNVWKTFYQAHDQWHGMEWNECECSESKNCIGLTHWRAHHRVLCRYCTCTLHTLNLEHEVRSRNDVYRNNNVCAQCAIIFVCFRCCCCFCWVGVCMSANVLHLWQQLQCKAGVQSNSATNNTISSSSRQAYPELHKNPSKVPKAIATRLRIYAYASYNTKTYVCVCAFVFLSLLFFCYMSPIDNG